MLFRFLFRKMWNTRWLTLSSLAGLIFAVAFTVSIPMYADGALKRVVTQSLQEKSEGLPAGSILMRYSAASGPTDLTSLQNVNSYINKDVPGLIGFPVQTEVRNYSIRSAQITPEDITKVDASIVRQFSLQSLSGLDTHGEIVQGRWFAGGNGGGDLLEAVVLDEALYRADMHVGDVFEYPVYAGGSNQTLRVKIVGTFKPKDATDPYWYQGLEGLIKTMLVSEPVMTESLLQQRKVPLHTGNWYYAFDLGEIRTSQLAPLNRTLDRLNIELYQRLKDTKVEISFASTLTEFRKTSLQLQTLLFTLAAPMIAMVFYFIAMNARQSLDKQRSDIAVLRSRGAGTRQIIGSICWRAVILGCIALLVGPFLGWFMAKSIGSANGFLTVC